MQTCAVFVPVGWRSGHPRSGGQHLGRQACVGAAQEQVSGCQHGAAGGRWGPLVPQRHPPASDLASQQHDLFAVSGRSARWADSCQRFKVSPQVGHRQHAHCIAMPYVLTPSAPRTNAQHLICLYSCVIRPEVTCCARITAVLHYTHTQTQTHSCSC